MEVFLWWNHRSKSHSDSCNSTPKENLELVNLNSTSTGCTVLQEELASWSLSEFWSFLFLVLLLHDQSTLERRKPRTLRTFCSYGLRAHHKKTSRPAHVLKVNAGIEIDCEPNAALICYVIAACWLQSISLSSVSGP